MNIEGFLPGANEADESSLRKQQQLDGGDTRQQKRSAEETEKKKETVDQRQDKTKENVEKSRAEKIQDYQDQARIQLDAHKKQVEDTDARNRALTAEAKAESGRGDFVASITQSAVLPGTMNTEQTQVEKRTAGASQEQFIAVGGNQPTEKIAKQEQVQNKEKQAAAKEQPAVAAASQEGAARPAAA